MPKRNRKQLSSPESFVTAFNKHQHLYLNPKEEKNLNPVSMKLIGVDREGKFKQERIILPQWRIDSIELRFSSNQKALINLNDVRRQLKASEAKQKQKRKQQQK